MTNKVYVVDYEITFNNGGNESRSTKVKNCMSELHAKVKLDEYVRKKYPNVKSINMSRVVDGSYANFKNMFEGEDNPFSDLLRGFGGK